ncbi:nicotinate-nucleotide adenylyltransferase [Thiococcus pfennigii]|jgi:nicotinate-nucleotide adenylyltransferase|uniref:nicotinate-nucleotide adenylyltransferase n=1 Tax=Thiococcus pfennigii TaxID=1057 RepID=UPI0019082A44|nr:nicotinate-nucleotide adenylyltransferase [Thiococcus pfennigii]MBK1700737.1 nicotinic acid mononucleotide adenylyltransferase [Thiococcus pfennigii]MBK1732379.1 nicotinic acid mononucleotide adenylyltransferase [Thiococcus pfennigii]
MIGILGGTFDPIHFGHLRPALEVAEALGLAELRLVPLNQAVHRAQPHADGRHRLAMVRAAIADQPGFLADARELERPGGSYSHDTLASLRAELGPRRPLCLLLGSDAFAGFLAWHRPHAILGLAHLVVMTRPGPAPEWDPDLRALLAERQATDPAALARRPAGHIHCHEVTQLAISATAIRRLIAAGRSARFLLPDPVIAIIEQAGLYRRAQAPNAPLAP